MEENSTDFPANRKQTTRIIGGLILVLILIVFVVIFSGQKSMGQQTAQQAVALFASDTPGEENSSTQDISPTMTPLPNTQTPTLTPILHTPTSVPPTATLMVTPAIAEGGLQIRCLRNDYQLPIQSPAIFSSADLAVQKSVPSVSGFVITIPVRACGVFVTFNQPVEDEILVEIFEGSDKTPWYRKSLVKVEDQENTGYAVLDHEYIVDPPYWNLSYTLKIRGKTQTYWEGGLELKRTFPGLCWDGSVPDPVYLQCPRFDRMEREPHPDMPTFVPGGLK